MAQVRFSTEAENDIDLIAAYTVANWGVRQADRYLATLEDSFDHLARNPRLGRSCDSLQKGLYRFEAGRHVVFYVPETDGALIVRVLHHSMLPTRHF